MPYLTAMYFPFFSLSILYSPMSFISTILYIVLLIKINNIFKKKIEKSQRVLNLDIKSRKFRILDIKSGNPNMYSLYGCGSLLKIVGKKDC